MVIFMKSINQNVESIYLIQKSKFITKMIKVHSNNEIEPILNKLKIQYPNATHYCYAYIIDNIKRFSDDGEPSGTAGFPILNVLDNNQLNYILCVVIRYFGGIKLGAGGLVRAYTKSVTNCLELADIYDLKECFLTKIEFSYQNQKYIDYYLKDYNILTKQFHETIEYTLYIPCNEYQNIFEKLSNITISMNKTDKLII